MEHFACLNGAIIDDAELQAKLPARIYYFGDSIYEEIHAHSTEMPLFQIHFDKIEQGAQILGYSLPADFTPQYIRQLATRLLNRNKEFSSTLVRLTLFRSSGTSLLPDSSAAGFMIHTAPLLFNKFEHQLPSMIVDVFPNQLKCAGELSPFSTGSELIYVQAAQYARSHKLDDCILTNQYGRLVESTTGNIFAVDGDTLVTPPLKDGCRADALRTLIVRQLAENMGYNIATEPIESNRLTNFDEVFAVNAILGLRNIVGFKTKRYYSQKFRKIQKSLQSEVFGEDKQAE